MSFIVVFKIVMYYVCLNFTICLVLTSNLKYSNTNIMLQKYFYILSSYLSQTSKPSERKELVKVRLGNHKLRKTVEEHPTSTAEVMGSNPVHAWIFFRVKFLSCKVVCITAMIKHIFIAAISRSSNIWSSIYIHLYFPPSSAISRIYKDGNLQNPFPSYLNSSVRRALHRYFRGHW